MDAWALTDHGNGSGLAHARTDAMKVIKRGKKYRQLYGVEFYFVPSLKDWQIQFSEHQDAVKAAKSSKIAEALATEEKIIAPAGEDEEAGGHVIENESETKEAKGNKPEWKRYYHLVAIAQNRKGLSNLFTLVKKSFKYGFYRFPRIDFEMLKEHGEGLLVSTACLTGDAELITDRGTETLLDVIERYRAGENPVVLSFNETNKELQFKRVLWGDKTRTSAKIVKIKTADNKEVRLTPDHRVLTDKGWLRADELKKNMPVKVVSL
jgi:DNA polymerase III alpha subunit